MAARAARAGHVVRGYDVVPGRAESLAADGVGPVDTAGAAVRGADLTVIMVATPEQLQGALFAPGGAAGSLAAAEWCNGAVTGRGQLHACRNPH